MLSYARGTYIPTDQLALPVAKDPIGTFRGYRIFTACRTVRGKVFQLDDHLNRILNSAGALYMELSHSKDEIQKIVEETVAKNWEESGSDLLVEIMLSGGKAAISGVAPAGAADLYVIIFPLKLPPEAWYANGVTLATYPFLRQFPEVKLLNYVGGVIAHQTVVKKFRADEALFITPDEERIILEGTTFNFFIVRHNVLYTHPLDGKILSGITRKVALMLAEKEGISAKEEAFTYDDLKKTDEAFLTSSTRNVVPVVKVDDTVIGNGKPGAITTKLIKTFDKYLSEA